MDAGLFWCSLTSLMGSIVRLRHGGRTGLLEYAPFTNY